MQSKIYLSEKYHNYARTIFSMLNVTPILSELQASTIEYVVEGEHLTKDVYDVHLTMNSKYGRIIKAELIDVAEADKVFIALTSK